MSQNNVTSTNSPTSTTFSSKAAKVKIRKSLSSPTNGPVTLIPPDPSMMPSTSELPKKEAIPIPPSPNKNSKKGKQLRLNTNKQSEKHLSSFSSSTTNSHDRPQLRMSASSRFGKSILPTWLGGHSNEDESPTTPNSANSPGEVNNDFDSIELEHSFETLLVRYRHI